MKQIATVKQILKVEPFGIHDYTVYVLCTDGDIYKLNSDRLDNDLIRLDDTIQPGYQFEYKSKIPPHCISTDYKLIYETIDKALQDSIDNILGKVMTALSGRVNPEEARKIIIDRLLLNKI